MWERGGFKNDKDTIKYWTFRATAKNPSAANFFFNSLIFVFNTCDISNILLPTGFVICS